MISIDDLSVEFDFDSNEEKYFFLWLQDMKEAGYIISYTYNPEPIELSPKVTYKVEKKLKTKTKVEDRLLLHKHQYTADFEILWDKSAEGLFYESIDRVVKNKEIPLLANSIGDKDYTYLDVKALYDRKDSNRRFSMTRKFVYDKLNIYTEQVIPQKLFEKTFTPERYLWTDKGVKLRTIHFKVRTLEEFITNNK